MILIDKSEKRPMYYQVYSQIKESIQKGHIQCGEKLLPIRTLCDELGVGRNTIINAYKQLVVEGYVKNIQGCGFVVEDVHKFTIHDTKEENHHRNLKLKKGKYVYDFTFSNLSSNIFSVSTFKNYMNKTFLDYDFNELFQYGEVAGLAGFREEIKKYLYTHRGIVCDVEQIVMCTGIQDALDQMITFVPQQYHTVGIENPCHYSIPKVFANRNVPYEPIHITPDTGYCDAMKEKDIKILVTAPSHQFPLGFNRGISDRYELLRYCAQNDILIFEDDYDNELRYDAKPIPSIFSIDQYEKVIYFGTFSKILAPGLRLSYMVLPKYLVKAYERTYGTYHSKISWFLQKTMELYMRDGQLEKHIRKSQYHYKKLSQILIATIKEQFGDTVKILSSGAGLHVLIAVEGAPDTKWLEKQARNNGVCIYPVDLYYWNQDTNIPENTVVLGFAGMDEESLVRGIKALYDAWYEIL